jgi:hypothetical protein
MPAKFQIGAAAYLVTNSIIMKEMEPNAKTLTPEQKCTLGRLGQQYATVARVQIQAAGSSNPAAAGEIMTNLVTQLMPYIDGNVKLHCK